MSNPDRPNYLNGGHYDSDGKWVQTKFCFVSCGDRCTCTPPGGVYDKIRTAEKSILEQALDAIDDDIINVALGNHIPSTSVSTS